MSSSNLFDRVYSEKKANFISKGRRKDTCCLSVVYALVVDCQLKVRMTMPGLFIPKLPV